MYVNRKVKPIHVYPSFNLCITQLWRSDTMLELTQSNSDEQGFATFTMEPGNPGKIWGPVPMHHLISQMKQHPDVRIATHQ